MKFNFLKVLLPLTLCFGFMASAQASLITSYNPTDINSSYASNSVQDWFDVEISNQFESFDLSFNWGDQGWGNRKGRLYYSISGENWIDFGLLAEHSFTDQLVSITRNELAFFDQPTTLKFGYVVGGGGGHRLNVNNINLAVNEIPEPTTLAIFALAMLGLASRKTSK